MATASFRGGLVVGIASTLVLTSALTVTRASEPGKAPRLLVSCGDDLVPAVMKAVHGLDVVVYDLRTMDELPIGHGTYGGWGAKHRDVAQIVDRVLEAVDSVQKLPPDDGATIRLLTLRDDGTWTKLGLRLLWSPQKLDLLADRLGKDETLAIKVLERGPLDLISSDGMQTWDVDVRMIATPQGATRARPRTSLEELESKLADLGSKIRVLPPARPVEPGTSATRLVACELAKVASLRAVVAAVAAHADIVAFSYHPTKSQDPGSVVFELGVR